MYDLYFLLIREHIIVPHQNAGSESKGNAHYPREALIHYRVNLDL